MLSSWFLSLFVRKASFSDHSLGKSVDAYPGNLEQNDQEILVCRFSLRETCPERSRIVTFPENPEQNDQKIRESKERGISSTFLVPDFPGWGSSASKMLRTREISPFGRGDSSLVF